MVNQSSILKYVIEQGIAALTPNPDFPHVGGHLMNLRRLDEETSYWRNLDQHRFNGFRRLPSPGPMDRMLQAWSNGMVLWKAGLRNLNIGQQHFPFLVYMVLQTDGFQPALIKNMLVPHSRSIVAIDPGQDLVVASSAFRK